MKKWLYFPHDLLAGSDVKLMNLIENGGLEMYGAYWVLIEHLRAQDGYRSDLSAIRSLARKVKISYTKLMKVVTDFDLFIVKEGSFYSPGLIKRMEPYDVKKDKSSENGKKGAAAKALKNSSTNSSEEEANRVEKSKVEKNKKTSYSEGKKVATVCDDTIQEKTEQLPVPRWEYFIDQAFEDKRWMGLVGRQSALKEGFEDNQLFIEQCFKDHIQQIGTETKICSLQEAKSYFSNFIRPGAATRPGLEQRLREELRSEDPYPYENYDPKTGIRSCFGIVIPSNAPPRPDCSVRWNQERNGWTN
ncbi:MAG TPA: Lin1244/Lin1753 domain-containing protein [Bacteroidales bacterium]